jgi:para-aminobenzoate synthetase component 1
MQRRGNKIISQPIKGTIRRGQNNEEDEQLKNELSLSEKERSENVMIVDLVRNDLSRIANRGSVKVEELFGIHTFKTVHHMISTVSAEVETAISFTDILRALYPMGSMTGAPKVRAMQLIDEYEHSARGLYSGSVGYITPNGDFDFNVVIRSILCNNALPYASYSAGSAITALSHPEKEYEECLLKAQAMMKALK